LADEEIRAKLEPVLELLAADPASLTSVRDPERAWNVHIADSLSGLEFIGSPPRLADVGSGAGFPGLALAAALPGTRIDLIESIARKCDFIRRAIGAGGLANARVVCDRAEVWASRPPPDGGREGYDVVTARAVGRLVTVAELGSPLLVDGGAIVVWKGRRDTEEEAELGRAADRLAIVAERIEWVGPFAGSQNRHLHLLRKAGPTPPGLPRRPGMAKKRPLGARAPNRGTA
jgi:16S rRNA (guanine527-N7)-methyltransferase